MVSDVCIAQLMSKSRWFIKLIFKIFIGLITKWSPILSLDGNSNTLHEWSNVILLQMNLGLC